MPLSFSYFLQFQGDVLDPAIKGTLNVLSSCRKCPSVKRVVLTSSIAAVMYTGRSLTPDVVIDENWFSDSELFKNLDFLSWSSVRFTFYLSGRFYSYSLLSSCDLNCLVLWQMWYAVSKTLAEEAAWRFSKENGIDMVALNPGRVIGPMLQPTLNASVAVLLKLINGVCPLLILSFFKPTELFTCNDFVLFPRDNLSKFNHELGLRRRCSCCTYLSIWDSVSKWEVLLGWNRCSWFWDCENVTWTLPFSPASW